MTYREELESEIRAITELIEDKQQELENLINARCDECDEWGNVEGVAYGNEISPPMVVCPNCHGTKVRI